MRNSVEFQPKQWPDFADTWIENWPPGLSNLSYPQIGIQLGINEVHSLGRRNGVHSHCFDPTVGDDLQSLELRLDKAMFHFPQGVFVRLGSRSPKDTLEGMLTSGKAFDGQQAIRLLTCGSARIAYDLRAAIKANYNPWIFVRQWADIPPDMEFRCFMQQRQLIGVSQYFHKAYFPRLNLEPIRETIRQLLQGFFPVLSKHCPLADVVFDVEISLNHPPEIKLIEINPFNELTDSCLFSWKKFDFDGGIRIMVQISACRVKDYHDD